LPATERNEYRLEKNCNGWDLSARFGEEGAMPRLAGNVAFITGAGTGIGHATAILFARAGAKVAIAEIDARNCWANL
jgi:short chain dehydrogenase